MNELTDNTNPVKNPQQAVAEFVGEQFIEWSMEYISHQMQSWPQIIELRKAHPRPEKIRKFMLQRFLAEEPFMGSQEGDPGFLRFAIANLSESDDPTAETALEILEKKRLEEIVTAHRELWLRLLKALGLTAEEIERSEPKEPTRNYIAELSDLYSTSEWQTAVGTFAAHERAVPEEYRAILTFLKNNTTLAALDYEILTKHIGSNTKFVNTNPILDKIVYDNENKLLVWEGIKRQLEIRQDFLAALLKYFEA